MTGMLIATTVVFATAACVLAFIAKSVYGPHPQVTVPASPVDHAERILASRYARGLITAEEYERMLAVLRR